METPRRSRDAGILSMLWRCRRRAQVAVLTTSSPAPACSGCRPTNPSLAPWTWADPWPDKWSRTVRSARPVLTSPTLVSWIIRITSYSSCHVLSGKLVEEMENKIRNNLNEIYFGKTRDIVNGLRSVVPLSESKQTQEFKVQKILPIKCQVFIWFLGSTEKCHLTEKCWPKLIFTRNWNQIFSQISALIINFLVLIV